MLHADSGDASASERLWEERSTLSETRTPTSPSSSSLATGRESNATGRAQVYQGLWRRDSGVGRLPHFPAVAAALATARASQCPQGALRNCSSSSIRNAPFHCPAHRQKCVCVCVCVRASINSTASTPYTRACTYITPKHTAPEQSPGGAEARARCSDTCHLRIMRCVGRRG